MLDIRWQDRTVHQGVTGKDRVSDVLSPASMDWTCYKDGNSGIPIYNELS